MYCTTEKLKHSAAQQRQWHFASSALLPLKCLVCVCQEAPLPSGLLCDRVFCTFANLISTGHWNKFIIKVLTHGLGMLKKKPFCYLIFSQDAPQLSEIPILEVLLVWAMSFWAVQHFMLMPLVSAWQNFDLCCWRMSWQIDLILLFKRRVAWRGSTGGSQQFLFFICSFFFIFLWALQSQKKSVTVNSLFLHYVHDRHKGELYKTGSWSGKLLSSLSECLFLSFVIFSQYVPLSITFCFFLISMKTRVMELCMYIWKLTQNVLFWHCNLEEKNETEATHQLFGQQFAVFLSVCLCVYGCAKEECKCRQNFN